jgi:beta-glucosidase
MHKRRARAEGIPLKSNFYWSAMDKLGRTNGLGTRFGLAYVDFRTAHTQAKCRGFREAAELCAVVLAVVLVISMMARAGSGHIQFR